MTTAAANGIERKKRRSISGSRAARLVAASRPAARPPSAANAPRIDGEVQPRLGRLDDPEGQRRRAARSPAAWPTGSKRRGLRRPGLGDEAQGQHDRGEPDRDVDPGRSTASRPPRRATPPTIGPSAIEIPKTAPHTPTAWARSRGSVKVLVTIDIATGFSIEPPTACSDAEGDQQPDARREAAEQRADARRPARPS